MNHTNIFPRDISLSINDSISLGRGPNCTVKYRLIIFHINISRFQNKHVSSVHCEIHVTSSKMPTNNTKKTILRQQTIIDGPTNDNVVEKPKIVLKDKR